MPTDTTATPTTTATTMSPTGAATQIDLSAVLQSPQRYDNQRITTTGIADQLTPFVLRLMPSGATAGDTQTVVPPTTQPTTGTTSPGTTTPGTTTPGTTTPGTGQERDGLVVVYGQIAAPEDGATVTVTGTVQDAFDVETIEQTLGITLNRQLIQSLGLGQDDAVLIADTIKTTTPATETTTTPATETTTTPATETTTTP